MRYSGIPVGWPPYFVALGATKFVLLFQLLIPGLPGHFIS
jgi:hypothetical protein